MSTPSAAEPGDLHPELWAEIFRRVVRPRGALQSCSDGTFYLEGAAHKIRSKILKFSDPQRAMATFEGAAAGIKLAMSWQQTASGGGPRVKGERTRTRVVDAWQSTHAVVTSQTGKTPQRRAMVSLVAEQLGLSESTVEKYAPRR
jgi:hypothetical protein